MRAKVRGQFVNRSARRQLVEHSVRLSNDPQVRLLGAQTVFQQRRARVKYLLLHLSERKRLARSQRRVLWAGSSDLVFNLVEFRLQLVELTFEFRRFLFFRIRSETESNQLFGNILLSIEVSLLALEQFPWHAFRDLRIRFRQEIQQ